MDPQPKKEYQYKTLESRQIRLVYLHPSNRETINCTIEHVSIDENPTFEALSYTWGTAMERFIINVGSASLSVGKNLAVALRALVSSDEPRAIWIDAICINQNDALERNHQVRFMKDIYTRARSVLVWLGEAADGSDAVMDYVGSLDPTSALTEHRAYVDYNDTWTWEKGDPFQRPPVPQGDVDALLCRPWFSRVWIQQEAAVNAVTKVTCGSKCVTWNQLFSLVWSYQKPSGTGFAKDAFHIDAMASSILIMMIQSYRYDDIETLLLDILRDCTYCGATDPRDRIYGVQNLAKDPDLDKLLLEPSYDISVPAVYTDLAKRFLTSQDTFILSWAGRSNQRSRDLPSWVPDWTMKNTEIPSIIFRAAGDVKSDCKLGIHDGKEALHVSGLTVSSISSLTDGPAMTAFRSRLDEVEVFQQLRENFEACITLVKNISIGFLGALQGAGSPIVQRQAAGCATGVHMIVARASTEQPGTGIIGSVADRVQAQIPGSDIVAVDYPAQLNPYNPSQRAGVTAMTKLVQDYAKQCPQTKMVLMGYSQGAHVTVDVLCGTSESGFDATPPQAADVTDKISAVVLMGDPSHVNGQPFNTGTSQRDGVFPRQDNAACAAVANKMTSFCDTGDPFCDGGSNIQVHLGYVRRNGDDAVKFIVDKVNAGGAGAAKAPGA
ncbi:hypothetical protein CkaCkLH20_12590 [Colletotrichum karsti]|uniref:Heterokaryon incompatibility domain-containing protein n=1 Tax=Colletotrichum karsti TaxID=1095194 RepID=A0A9P6HW42_9PEZI|nr:uncharacterized protein CkaCkLH20_12590 [Colletotrichum karsti]KAF9869981.1 hypothetical protein CkaCkLH20_12590 [Colletotrichum karsti]